MVHASFEDFLTDQNVGCSQTGNLTKLRKMSTAFLVCLLCCLDGRMLRLRNKTRFRGGLWQNISLFFRAKR